MGSIYQQHHDLYSDITLLKKHGGPVFLYISAGLLNLSNCTYVKQIVKCEHELPLSHPH